MIDFDATYRIDGYDGIAFRLLGFNESYYYDSDLGEYYEDIDVDNVRAVMIGDNRVFIEPVEDLHKLDEGTYCNICGQIGCGH